MSAAGAGLCAALGTVALLAATCAPAIWLLRRAYRRERERTKRKE